MSAGAELCNFLRLRELSLRRPARARLKPQMLWVPRLRGHTNSGRESNLSSLLRRHSRPSWRSRPDPPQARARRRPGRGFKDRAGERAERFLNVRDSLKMLSKSFRFFPFLSAKLAFSRGCARSRPKKFFLAPSFRQNGRSRRPLVTPTRQRFRTSSRSVLFNPDRVPLITVVICE